MREPMATAVPLPEARPASTRSEGASEVAEQRFLLSHVPWWMYVAMRDSLGDDGTRMTYLDGRLELMSPSLDHEAAKTLIARLLEAWAVEALVDLWGFGSTTFRKEAKKRGLEPDECYALEEITADGAPAIALEIVVSSPLLDKLDVYAGLGVAEVWIWQDGRLTVKRLVGEHYEQRARSEVLPQLDLDLLASFVRRGESPTALTRAYLAALRAAG